ncbi:type I-F CRISPR-associated helicase Cas3f [Alcaligenes sp. SDU_A2]|uniref:type I-F CRISPR-associated helicase Cas3f n=1 Tax=Alcaligenes sp. SDU_A2 TaxID=3136634 RepID=UPI00311F4884
MNIMLVSQCTKQALTQTRRILDQFAERRGERTWQTSITQAGLDTLRKLLRKSARKNTAVACHWIRAKDHTELLWVVGNAAQFNAQGAVPTNSTTRDVLRVADENNWHGLSFMALLTALAALLHDLGKSSRSFQDRLRSRAIPEKNRYRHEWVSVRLFQAFVGTDDDQSWLARLVQAPGSGAGAMDFEQQWLGRAAAPLFRDGLDKEARHNKPFAQDGTGLPPLAQAVAWLVLTHHRLPACPDYLAHNNVHHCRHGQKPQGGSAMHLDSLLGQVDADWNEPWPVGDTGFDESARIWPYWQFPVGLPVRTAQWRKRAARLAHALQAHAAAAQSCLFDPYIMHLSRLSLMLADHYYSGLKKEDQRCKGEKDFPLYANTDRQTGALLQTLDEHLLGVEHHAGRLVRSLPGLTAQLAHLISHRQLRQRSAQARFRWQDKAADIASAIRLRSQGQGVFIVNMASTGCGKTLGNARIMNALAEPGQGMRCAFAIGLRTLTLQTGRSFQTDLGLGEDQLAIQVGGAAQREIFDYYEQVAERTGSASRQSLLDETGYVVYEANADHPALQQLAHDGGAQKLLMAPLLVCTVDHLTPATESLRGGRQIAPMLRLLTGDLVLDEPDDFDLADLPALTRLVYWAGLLGSRVLLSSATLAPALVQGLFLAYSTGRGWFQRNRGARPDEPAQIACLWVDEFHQAHEPCAQGDDFFHHHSRFVQKRMQQLARQPMRRQAQLLPLPASMGKMGKHERRVQLADTFRTAIGQLHKAHHGADPLSGKRVSFGLVRMANINPLFDVAVALHQAGMPQGVQLHLCVYHSQYPLVMRSAIEHMLDQVLNRRQEDAVFQLPVVRQALDTSTEQDHVFVVLGSPVTEVGRDHDYDWAIVEPSSMRSIIQLAGRVLRHRVEHTPKYPNVLLCNANVLHFDAGLGKPAFCRPGFESEGGYCLESHLLEHALKPLLDKRFTFPIDAGPRIAPRPMRDREPHKNLVDLEHARLEELMLPVSASLTPDKRPTPVRMNASSFWSAPHVHLLGFLQQMQPFREQTTQQVDLTFLPDDDDRLRLHRIAEGEQKWKKLYVAIDASLRHDTVLPQVPGVHAWPMESLQSLMERQAQDMDMPLDAFARRFGLVSVTASDQGWRWHESLGFSRKV